MTNIEGHVLLTGGHGGLGATLRRLFINAGWQVTSLVRQSAGGINEIACDLGSSGDVQRVLATLSGAPAIIVHAAVDGRREIEDTVDLMSQYQVNCVAPYVISRSLGDRNADSPRRTLHVHIGSEVTFHADAKSGPYAATKASHRVLASALADRFRGTSQSVATIVLGPLYTPRRCDEISLIAQRIHKSEAYVERTALARSNPDLVISRFIRPQSVFEATLALWRMGEDANGSLIRLDGGSGGSLN